MKFLVFLIFTFFNLAFCDYELPEEFHGAKDALEARRFDLTLENFEEHRNGEPGKKPGREGRVSGGVKANEGQFPYQAVLYMRDDEGTYVCGGSLIRRQWILTAAHCVDKFDEVYAFLGTINRVNGPFAWKSERIRAENIFVHHGYYEPLLTNDIALVHLDAPEDLLSYRNIATIDIPLMDDQGIDLEGLEGTVSGFGRVNDTHKESSADLLYASMPIIANDVCLWTFPQHVLSSNLCTNTLSGKSPCSGDSGGPLTAEIVPGRRIVVGLVSFGSSKGCTVGYPAVFCRVSSFVRWIEGIVGSEREETTKPNEIPEEETTPDASMMISMNIILLFFTSLFLFKFN